MADVPKLEKKRALLAPKAPKGIGPLGTIVLLTGTALAGLGMARAVVLPTLTPGIQSAASPTSTNRAAPLVLQGVEMNAALAAHGSHSSHASHASHHSSSFA